MSVPSILFICTYNSVRSQLAEGACRLLHPDWNIFSAGVACGHISRHAILVLEENAIDASMMQAKHLTDLSQNAFDLIVVLCENAWKFREGFPHAKRVLFHPVRSPELCCDDELFLYRKCFEELKDLIRSLA